MLPIVKWSMARSDLSQSPISHLPIVKSRDKGECECCSFFVVVCFRNDTDTDLFLLYIHSRVGGIRGWNENLESDGETSGASLTVSFPAWRNDREWRLTSQVSGGNKKTTGPTLIETKSARTARCNYFRKRDKRTGNAKARDTQRDESCPKILTLWPWEIHFS